VLGRQGSIYITNQGILNIGNTFYSDITSWIVALLLIGIYSVLTMRSRAQRRAAGLTLQPARNLALRMGVVIVGVLLTTLIFALDRGLPLVMVIFSDS